MNISLAQKLFAGVAVALAALLVACSSGVDEGASGTVTAKVEERALGPGATAQVSLDLSAGKYVLLCNVGDHYKQGMYTALQVTEAGPGTGVAVELGEWFVKSSSTSVAPGPIMLDMTNKGTSSHNLVVIKTERAPEALVLK